MTVRCAIGFNEFPIMNLNMAEDREQLIKEMQEELFLKQDKGWFRILSGSMRPLMDIDDRVLAKRVEPTESSMLKRRYNESKQRKNLFGTKET